MADPGKTHKHKGKHASMTKLSTADRYWRNLFFLMYKGIQILDGNTSFSGLFLVYWGSRQFL